MLEILCLLINGQIEAAQGCTTCIDRCLKTFSHHRSQIFEEWFQAQPPLDVKSDRDDAQKVNIWLKMIYNSFI